MSNRLVKISAIVLSLFVALLAAVPAQAYVHGGYGYRGGYGGYGHGYYGRGYYGGFGGVFIGGGYYPYYYPNYYAPYYYPQPVAYPVDAAPVQASYQGSGQCREYTQNIVVDGATRQAYGHACLQPDGNWQIVD